MNEKESQIERKRLYESFELYMKSEVTNADLSKSDESASGYSDIKTSIMFQIYRAGWYGKSGDILTYGDPDLSRLFGMKHPNKD